ncbi:hypothetical protein BaRGS_00032414 [Batillaria attramentaria]|uniref:Uncharacterized protein n=1 Tax=Batillaria attramentaria TaxID=370345 RepID=A0ABD0JNX4_9CAEN
MHKDISSCRPSACPFSSASTIHSLLEFSQASLPVSSVIIARAIPLTASDLSPFALSLAAILSCLRRAFWERKVADAPPGGSKRVVSITKRAKSLSDLLKLTAQLAVARNVSPFFRYAREAGDLDLLLVFLY